MSKHILKDSFIRGTPIIMGYLPVGIAYGILARNTGLSLIQTIAASMIVFAGASQFMLLNFISSGVGALQIVTTVFLVNFRHFVMSASIAARLENTKKRFLPLIAFGITDESFSVLSSIHGSLDKKRILLINTIGYTAWFTASAAGYIAGEILPEALGRSMEIGLYALFIALLMPMAKKSLKTGVVAVGSGIFNLFLSYLDIFPAGWSIVVSVIVCASLAGLLNGGKENE